MGFGFDDHAQVGGCPHVLYYTGHAQVGGCPHVLDYTDKPSPRHWPWLATVKVLCVRNKAALKLPFGSLQSALKWALLKL